MKYKLVIFDMDGTILDTLEDLANSLNYALDLFGFPRRTLQEVRRFVGNGIRRLIECGVPAGTAEEKIEEVCKIFSAHYKSHCFERTSPYVGVPEVLQALRDRGVPIAVVSNKADFAVQELCERYFPGVFDVVVGERAAVRKKPAPDSVNAVLEMLQIDRRDAVYVGDSEVDIATAENAAMDCIAVSWGFRDEAVLKAHNAKVIVDEPAKLLKFL